MTIFTFSLDNFTNGSVALSARATSLFPSTNRETPRPDTDPGLLMYMPGGTHEINCGLGGSASARVTVNVGPETATILDASLFAINRARYPHRACFDLEHEGKEAMAWPTGFVWKEGPKPGVYASVDYSSLGDLYTQRKVVRAFSGSFFTDANLPKMSQVVSGKTYAPKSGERGSRSNPAGITGLDFPYAGTLTNNPAFRQIAPLVSSYPSPEIDQPPLSAKQAELSDFPIRFQIPFSSQPVFDRTPLRAKQAEENWPIRWQIPFSSEPVRKKR